MTTFLDSRSVTRISDEGDFWAELVEILVFATVPGKFLGTVGQDPSDIKSNRLHVAIFWFCFIHLRYLTIDSYPEISNFNQLFLKLNRFICN